MDRAPSLTLALRAAATAAVALSVGCGASATEARMVTSVPASLEQEGEIERYDLRSSEVSVEADVSAGSAYSLRFSRVRGTLVLSPTLPEASTTQLQVDIGSATATWQLVADVAMSDFLHAAQHPEATFVTRSIRRAQDAEAGAGYELFADFTLHGVKKTMAVPASIQVDSCRARMHCEFEIERSVFGTVDDGSYETFVSDDVVIRIAIDVPRVGAPKSCKSPRRAAENVAASGAR
jgi:polyisoprenoid-binding protein YceI